MGWGDTLYSAGRAVGAGINSAWRSSPLVRHMMTGAAVGGVYGGFSRDGSVLGGATKGALAGAAVRHARAFGSGAMSRWNNAAGYFGGGMMKSGLSTLGRAGMRGMNRAAQEDKVFLRSAANSAASMFGDAKVATNDGWGKFKALWR